MAKSRAPCSSSMNPGAVPIGFGRISLPSGKKACLRLLSLICRPTRAKNSRMIWKEPSSNFSSRPNESARTSVVKSSRVGPRPPEIRTRSLREIARFRASPISAGSSRTEVWKWHSMSDCNRHWAISALLESTISPLKSSSPIVSTSAFMIALLYPFLSWVWSVSECILRWRSCGFPIPALFDDPLRFLQGFTTTILPPMRYPRERPRWPRESRQRHRRP